MSLNFLSHPFHRAFSFSIMARFFPARNLFAPLVTANSHFPCIAVAIVTIVWRGNEGETQGALPLDPSRDTVPAPCKGVPPLTLSRDSVGRTFILFSRVDLGNPTGVAP